MTEQFQQPVNPGGKKVGYIRVSTGAQHTERQERALEMMCGKTFVEKVSGRDTTNRPELAPRTPQADRDT